MNDLNAWKAWLKKMPLSSANVPSYWISPTEMQLKHWASSEWIEYQAWLFHHSFLSLHDWQQLRHHVMSWKEPLFFSLVTPVYNTNPIWLKECVDSVRTQIYPYWQWCLVDDGSSRKETRAYLAQLARIDPRIEVYYLPQNKGICTATNLALSKTNGRYVAFLDHDDRLAPEALFYMATILQKDSSIDILYSDRDSLSLNNTRFMHLCKPNWSPETLLSGNYLFHLLVYRRSLLEELGGLEKEAEGSQDYDLILRAAEKNPKIHHVNRILYHWRQHTESISLEHNAKEYVYQAGLNALQNSLQRRGIAASIYENTALWRGNYRVCLPSPRKETWQQITLDPTGDLVEQYRQAWAQADEKIDYLLFLTQAVAAFDPADAEELLSWLSMPHVGLVTGQVIDKIGNFKHAGLVMRAERPPLSLYFDHPHTQPGYMGATAIIRNVSAPHPWICAMSRAVWESLGGIRSEYHSGFGLLDLALRAQQQGWRCVYTPFASFVAPDWPDSTQLWDSTELIAFNRTWHTWLTQGDPYYNRYLTLDLVDMGLDLSLPKRLNSSILSDFL